MSNETAAGSSRLRNPRVKMLIRSNEVDAQAL